MFTGHCVKYGDLVRGFCAASTGWIPNQAWDNLERYAKQAPDKGAFTLPSIEAAHAGKVGKGFVVVAAEIRKLAETATVQAKSFGGTLTQIQKRLAELTAVSGRIERAYAQTNDLILESNKAVDQVKAAVAEQVACSQQV